MVLPVCVYDGEGGSGATAGRSSVGVIAVVVCITVAVFVADLCAARRWGVFSAGRVGRHPPLLAVPNTTLKQA